MAQRIHGLSCPIGQMAASARPRHVPRRALAMAAGLCGALLLPRLPAIISAAAACASVAAWATDRLVVPGMGRMLAAAGRTGADLSKPGRPVLPESLGIAAGFVYVVAVLAFLPAPFAGVRGQPVALHRAYVQLGEYTAALLSCALMLLLGFVDDVVGLRWRHKVVLPALAALPLLIIYGVTGGGTSVLLPTPRGSVLLALGAVYYAYMAALAVFCTHAINILAGVNGVEAGQALVLGAAALAHNVAGLLRSGALAVPLSFALSRGDSLVGRVASALARNHVLDPASESAVLAVTLLLPFVAVSAALLRHNWFPASVFVGDTYCYFAGMALAVAAILGHYGKTMLALLGPQVLNFCVSLPQLCGLVPCPRHRMPAYAEADGLLHASSVTFRPRSGFTKALVRTMALLRLVRLSAGADGAVTVTNMTLLNAILVNAGPMREESLATALVALQTLHCTLVLLVRHVLCAP